MEWVCGIGCMTLNVEVWKSELRPIVVDKEVTKEQAKRYRMGSVRLALGRMKTANEFAEEKERILKKPLP